VAPIASDGVAAFDALEAGALDVGAVEVGSVGGGAGANH
jgi:hypothetical protein